MSRDERLLLTALAMALGAGACRVTRGSSVPEGDDGGLSRAVDGGDADAAGGGAAVSEAGPGLADGLDAPAAEESAVPEDAAASPGDTAGPDAGSGDAGTSDAAPLPPSLPLAQVLAAKPQLIGTIAGRTEGPTWRDGELFFSVVTVNQGFYRIKADGKMYHYLPLSPNGSFLLADGSILVCDDKYTLVQVFPDQGKVGIVASGGVCNDITVDSYGNIYFSDFINTVYRITPDGVQTKALTGLKQPNGLEVDPAGEYLYILPRPADILRVAIGPSGPMGMPEKVGQLGAITDGCAFDAWGNFWVAVFGLGQIAIFDPVQLKVLGSFSAGAASVTNLTFGGPARDTLFVTTENHGVYEIPVGARGFATHPGAPKYALRGYANIAVTDQPVTP